MKRSLHGSVLADATSISYRLVHNYASLPDVRVDQKLILGSSSSWLGYVCDNPGTTQYYTEIALNGMSSAVQRVSKMVTLNHC